MKILFYKRTNLAENPDTWAAAFNKYTKHECRVVNYIPQDLTSFDFVHFNNTYEPFEGFEKKSIMHYHGHPDFEGMIGQIDLRFPGKVVVNNGHKAQGAYQDKQAIRWFPIDLDKLCYCESTPTDYIRVCYSPSRTSSISSYHDKGYTKVLAVFDKVVARRSDIFFLTIKNVPRDICLNSKALHNVVIDEFNTGNGNMSGFEGLAMGCMVLGKISPENNRVLTEEICTPAAVKIPYESMELDELEEFLVGLKLEYVLEQGAQNRKWIEENWNLQDMLKEMENIYMSVLTC